MRERSRVIALSVALAASTIALPMGGQQTAADHTGAWSASDFAGSEVLDVTIPVKVVFVGFDPATVLPQAILDELPPDYEPHDRIHPTFDEEPVRLIYDYETVFAPDAFAEALFAAATASSEMGPAPGYLLQYDALPLPGRQRLQDDVAESKLKAKVKAQVTVGPLPVVESSLEVDAEHIQYVDVKEVEGWIHETRAAFGLGAPDPSFTIFFLDSYTKSYMRRDTYHYYQFKENRDDSHPMANSAPKDWELLHSTAMYVPGPLADGDASEEELASLRELGGPFLLADAGVDGVGYTNPATGATLYPGGFPNPYDTKERVKTLRGWGGNHDFIFLDVGAAPSNDEDFFLLTPGDSAVFDPPIWDYAYQSDARDAIREAGLNPYDFLGIGFDIGGFSFALARDAHFGLSYVLAPSLLYHPTTKQRVHIQNWVIYDVGVDVANYDRDDADVFDAEQQRARLATHSPWTVLTNEVHFVHLPDDDPELSQALLEAKAKGGGYSYVCGTCLKEYVAANADKYLAPPPGEPDVKVIPTFVFHFAGVWQVVVPVIPVAISDSTPDGFPFAIFTGLNEPFRSIGYFDLTTGTIHETGHHLGFSHTHDGELHQHDDEEHPNDYVSTSHYTWENSESVMGYRTDPFGFNEQERENLARVQAGLILNEARETAFEALEYAEAKGTAGGAAIQAAAGLAAAKIAEVSADFAEGDWFGALFAADEARDLAKELVSLTGTAPLASAVFERSFLLDRVPIAFDVGLNFRCCLVFAGIPIRLNLSPGNFTGGRAERVVVTAEWTNNATDWGDLYLGYDFETDNFADAIFDFEEEKAGDGPHVLTLSFDPNVHRDTDVISVFVGSQDLAVEAKGTLRAEVFYRDPGG